MVAGWKVPTAGTGDPRKGTQPPGGVGKKGIGIFGLITFSFIRLQKLPNRLKMFGFLISSISLIGTLISGSGIRTHDLLFSKDNVTQSAHYWTSWCITHI